jgi:transcription elongation factor GreA
MPLLFINEQPMSKAYITKERLAQIEQELHHLKTAARREIAAKIAEARAQGDLSENAEYDAAREEQGLLELRIHKMEQMLMSAEIIDESAISTDKVGVLSRVRVVNTKTKRENVYQLVSQEDADFEHGRISISSPIGKALLNQEVGAKVSVKVPAGKLELEIIEIFR